MTLKQPWKFCVIGNIKKQHTDENGNFFYGTPAFTGGTKVYLCGKYWNETSPTIGVIGLNRRGKHFQFHEVPVNLIENVRTHRVYNPTVLELMNHWEYYEDWWHDTSQDRREVIAFVQKWNTV